MIVKIAFILILAAAALSDLWRYRIPNSLVGALVVLFAIAAVLHFDSVVWWQQLSAAALCLVVGYAFYHFDHMGAGDVKLIAAAALWSGLQGLLPFMVLVAIAGLAVMAVIVSARYSIVWGSRWGAFAVPEGLPRVLQMQEGIPYGVAICVGAGAATAWFPAWLWS